MSNVIARRQRLRVRWTAWGASVVVLLLGGALVESTASYGGRRAVPKGHAIAVALAWDNNSWMLSPFPRQEGRVACRIPVGGPPSPQPRSVPGNCQTRVSVGRTYVTVAFSEAWDEKDFDGEGGRATGSLTHTWFVIETKKLKALDNGAFGDVPPQAVM
jgi:hypothetical protein